MTVYAGMPVKTSIKCRMVILWLHCKRAVRKSHTRLIRKFPLHTSQGNVVKVRCTLDSQLTFTIDDLELSLRLCGDALHGKLKSNEGDDGWVKKFHSVVQHKLLYRR